MQIVTKKPQKPFMTKNLSLKYSSQTATSKKLHAQKFVVSSKDKHQLTQRLKGTRLKNKSRVHDSIIDSTGRRKRSQTDWVKSIMSTKVENWGKNGIKVAVPEAIISDLKNKSNANVMVLGPGKGAEILFISEIMKSKKANIDTLGLGNQLTEQAKALVRKDYSPDIQNTHSKDLFEHMNHLIFVKKYDYIYSAYGPVLHTNFVEVSILKVASMLKPGGTARIVPFFKGEPIYENKIKNVNDYLKKRNFNDKLDIYIENKSLIINRKK